MTEVQMRELVSATFVAGWALAQPDVPLWLENEAQPTADTFALMTIAPTTSQQMTLGGRGSRRVRRNGYVQVKLWTPADQGSAGASALVDAVRGIIEMVTLPSPTPPDESLTTQASSSQPIGTDGRWYMMLVRTPFWYAEHR